jgi:hypothetical protein
MELMVRIGTSAPARHALAAAIFPPAIYVVTGGYGLTRPVRDETKSPNGTGTQPYLRPVIP